MGRSRLVKKSLRLISLNWSSGKKLLGVSFTGDFLKSGDLFFNPDIQICPEDWIGVTFSDCGHELSLSHMSRGLIAAMGAWRCFHGSGANFPYPSGVTLVAANAAFEASESSHVDCIS